MSDDVSSLFNKVFIGAMILINLSLILYILLSSLTINLTLEGGKLFGFTDSFYGALLGAIITGSTAITIFVFDVITRKRSEAKEIKRINLNNLIKLQFINNQVIHSLGHFSTEFSEVYNVEKDFKFQGYIKDIRWLHEETRKIDTSLLTDKLLRDYLTYSRLLSALYNEISLFPALPMEQKIANIGNLVAHVDKVKIDFENFEAYVEVIIKANN